MCLAPRLQLGLALGRVRRSPSAKLLRPAVEHLDAGVVAVEQASGAGLGDRAVASPSGWLVGVVERHRRKDFPPRAL